MSEAIVAHDGAHTAQRAPAGMAKGKVAIWLFLSSEVLFFVSLIAIFLVSVQRAPRPFEKELGEIILVSINSFILLGSSYTVVSALDAAHRQKAGAMKGFLAATLGLGALFMGVQAYEYSQMVMHHGVTLTSDLYGTVFFTLTGFHGFHVLIGLIWLVPLLIMALRNKITPANSGLVEIFGLYWHFVDVVWVVLFTLVYLIY